MTYQEAIAYLGRLQLFGTRLGLENTFRLARWCGNPQDRLKFIHVAGTNGKGSTCAMLESIYREAGERAGLFTSPHLISFTERIQMNRAPIAETEVVGLVERVRSVLEQGNAREGGEGLLQPTFFEFVTVMALEYFAAAGCDLVIWETGMGGRLDSTNIVLPEASVITNIQRDHERWLGQTLEAIAAEKAGIIKTGRPVVTGTTDAGALEVIRQTAREREAPLAVVTAADLEDPLLARARLGLRGTHQRWNAAVALATVRMLGRTWPVSDEQVLDGLARVQWPGRLQGVQLGRTQFILDGAHNPDGARTLAAALREEFAGEAPVLLLGLFGDKDWPGMCEALMPQAGEVWLVPVQSERAANLEEVRTHAERRFPGKPIRVCRSLAEGLAEARQRPFAVVAGSLHLVGEAMELLGLGAGAVGERGLNEWDANRAGVNVTDR